MSRREVLPVLPLRDAVILPRVAVPLAAGRRRSLRALELAGASDGRVFVVAQKDPAGEAEAGNLHPVGVVARIVQAQKFAGGVQLVVEGLYRARVERIEEADDALKAHLVELLEEAPLDPADPAFQGLVKEVRERAAEYAEQKGVPEEVVRAMTATQPAPAELADQVAGHLELPVPERLALLEEVSVEARLRRVLVALEKAIGIAEAQAKIRSDVEAEVGTRQREMFLREQLKAIQRELGEGGEGQETARLRERIAKLQLPEEARAEVDRQLARAARVPRDSAEGQVLVSWLEWIADLPWSTRTEDAVALPEARKILDEDHFGLQDVKRRVLEVLAVRQLRAARAEGVEAKAKAFARGPILLFLGPPGTGKTSVARSIARALGRKYMRVAVGGARDEADVRGHRRTYVGAMPGRILQAIRRAGMKNPVICLDEIDKLGASFHGDPAAALLEVLDPAQNDKFVDHYLDLPFDLSEVLFVCTANFREGIPAPLLDRLEPIEFAGYIESEKAEIVRRYLLPRSLEESGLGPDQLRLDDGAVRAMIQGWTREAGLRQLERELGTLARKAALKLAEGGTGPVAVGATELRAWLGRPKVRPESKLEGDQVGVATGMYYTPMGGDIMLVEASGIPGEPGLVLTGQLGDVMKESARAALTWTRAHRAELGIDPERLVGAGLHIHVPAGAIPKDGPSAGIALAAAVASALSGRPVSSQVAATGEITLLGRVLPVGGLKEKLLGALRAGITRVILPRGNADDLDDLPPEARARLEVTLVDRLEDALQVLLALPAARPVSKAA